MHTVSINLSKDTDFVIYINKLKGEQSLEN